VWAGKVWFASDGSEWVRRARSPMQRVLYTPEYGSCETRVMQVALASELEFATPRTDFEIDVEGIIAHVPPTVMSKGMFFNRCLGLAQNHDEVELLRAAGIGVPRFVPFADYPWADFVRLSVVVANVICDGRTAAGLREIGRSLYGEFADSLAGRMTFGILRNNADRVIGLGAKAWTMSGIPGRLYNESLEDCHYRYHFTEYPADYAETLAVGVIEGALHSCGEVAVLKFARADIMNSIVDIRWG
jgi:uncharacterized protein (TIGR02265 family)